MAHGLHRTFPLHVNHILLALVSSLYILLLLPYWSHSVTILLCIVADAAICIVLWTGNHAGIWYHQWTIIWKHKKLDTEYRRSI